MLKHTVDANLGIISHFIHRKHQTMTHIKYVLKIYIYALKIDIKLIYNITYYIIVNIILILYLGILKHEF